jgi:hypothetical protein
VGGRYEGVLLNIKGNIEISFAWDLEKATNNQLESYALYQSILLEKESINKSLIVIGDSSTIINIMVSK